jgi:hypothetical protein
MPQAAIGSNTTNSVLLNGPGKSQLQDVRPGKIWSEQMPGPPGGGTLHARPEPYLHLLASTEHFLARGTSLTTSRLSPGAHLSSDTAIVESQSTRTRSARPTAHRVKNLPETMYVIEGDSAGGSDGEEESDQEAAELLVQADSGPPRKG